MKFTTMTTAALLGTALALQAQVETERSRSATQGGLHTSEATRLQDGGAPGESTERQRERAAAGAERAQQEREHRQGQADQPGTQQPGSPGAGVQPQQPGQPGTQPGQPRQPGTQQPGAGAGEDWRGADHEDMQLGDVSAEIQQGLRQAAAGGQLDGEVTRIRFGQEQLFRGKADIDGAEDVHVYVNAQGKLVKTQQEVAMENAPEAVRQAARQHDEQRGVDKILREMSDGSVSYILELDQENDQTRWIQMDESGRVMKTHEQQDNNR